MNSNLKSACRYALLTGGALALVVPSVFAQNAPAAATSNQAQNVQLGKVLVTGSAIPRTSIETAAPVTVITAKEIQESGLTTLGAVVRTLSADNSGTIPLAFTNGFAAGSSGVSLRGLTVNSTLVLIDGKRTAAYALADDGERSFTDLNSIPMNAVERIEVLKDGASSIYGADAIGGVVNIILYPSYQGSRATAQIGTSQHGGGTDTRFTYLTGTGDLNQNNYNTYVSFEYELSQPIWNRNRGFPLNTGDLSSVGGLDLNGGNPNNFSGSPSGPVAPATLSGTTASGQLNGTAVGPYQLLNPCGTSGTPSTQKTIPGTGPGTGNYCEYNGESLYGQLQPQETRYGLDGRITLKLNDANQAWVNLSFDQTRFQTSGFPAQIQTSTPNNTNAIVLPPTLLNGTTNPNDPFAGNTPAQGQYAAISYQFADIPAYAVQVNHNLRVVTDLNGALSENWNYDGSLTVNHTWLNINNYGFINYPQLISDINTGAYSFVNPASNSPQVLAALSPVLSKTSTTDMDAVDFTINGEEGSLPGGPIGIAVGTQWRYEAQDDPDLNPGLQAQGLGIAHTIGHRNVAAVYGELLAPVLNSLQVDLSAREDHYSDFGSAFSPKIGIKWTPIPQFGLRGTYSRGFRAPSFSEIGSSASEGFVTYTPPTAFQALHGFDNYVTVPYGLAELSTANPNVKPERARNYTFGLVFQPLESLSGTLDYYNIRKTNLIALANGANALSAYYAGQPIPAGFSVTPDIPDPAFPTLMPRPSVVGAPYQNFNDLKTSGLDLDLRYTMGFGNGLNWTSDFGATKIISWCQSLFTGSGCVDMVGTQGPYILSSGAGTPKYRAQWSNSFTFGPATITGIFYYVSDLYMSVPDLTGPGTQNLCFSNSTPTGANLPPDCRMPSFTYFDLTGKYTLSSTWSLTAGILNAFNRKPPFDPIDYAGTGASYNPTWAQQGAVGRFFQIGVEAQF